MEAFAWPILKIWQLQLIRMEKKQPKDKVLGQDIPGTSGTVRISLTQNPGPGFSRTNSMQGPFFWYFRQGMADVRDLGLHARAC